MAYDIVLDSPVQVQYAINNYQSYEDEHENSSNVTRLVDVARTAIYQNNIHAGHQISLSDRVLLCKSSSTERDNEASDRKVEQGYSFGSSIQRDADGKTSSKIDGFLDYTVTHKDSDRSNNWRIEGEIKNKEGEGVSYRAETRYSGKF